MISPLEESLVLLNFTHSPRYLHGFSGSVYSGHQSILIPPSELEVNPSLWLSAVSQFKVRDTFCSYSVMELCTKGLGLQTEALKVKTRWLNDRRLNAQVHHLTFARLPSLSREGWTCPV